MKAAEVFGNSEQLITRREAIDVIKKHRRLHDNDLLELLEYELEHLPSAGSEQLTDNEQRIFLAAMAREEKVCRQVDDEYRNCREPYEDSLVRICHEITRKVKGALWTI